MSPITQTTSRLTLRPMPIEQAYKVLTAGDPRKLSHTLSKRAYAAIKTWLQSLGYIESCSVMTSRAQDWDCLDFGTHYFRPGQEGSVWVNFKTAPSLAICATRGITDLSFLEL